MKKKKNLEYEIDTDWQQFVAMVANANTKNIFFISSKHKDTALQNFICITLFLLPLAILITISLLIVCVCLSSLSGRLIVDFFFLTILYISIFYGGFFKFKLICLLYYNGNFAVALANEDRMAQASLFYCY